MCVVAVVALFYAVEAWRGKRVWRAYRKEMEAKGVVFDIHRLTPPAVPDDQNFAMTPFLAPLFDTIPGTGTYRDTNKLAAVYRAFGKWPGFSKSMGNWRKGDKLDFTVLLESLRKHFSSSGTTASEPGGVGT
ncbi:MAG: hypothetical protein N3G20_10895, partial [Verrucomicrobiae bacterium]|nr:hypothetical protein [Verrucomicrobiae bacterium]